MIRFTAPFFLLAAFVLLLLVTLSVPIIHSIYLLTATANISVSVLGFTGGVYEDVNFGIWGWCASPRNVDVLGATTSVEPAQCSAPHLGYTFDSTVLSLLQVQNLSPSEVQDISRGITAALVLHPIAAGLTFLALLFSLHHAFTSRPSRLSVIVTLPLTILASLVTTVIFAVDVAFIVIARNQLTSDTSGAVSLGFGNAVWMVLGAMIALWLGIIAVSLGVCCNGSRRTKAAY